MSGCGGNCSCGKGSANAVQEKVFLTQINNAAELRPKHNWDLELKNLQVKTEIVEVRFKNNRKEFYKSTGIFNFVNDERVLVEALGGFDVGSISLSGNQALRKYEKMGFTIDKSSLSKILRRADEIDLKAWLNARKLDRHFLLKSRQLARQLKLEITINDIEVRGDGEKTIVFLTSASKLNVTEFHNSCSSLFNMKVELHDLSEH